MSRLASEIQQGQPFASREAEAYLNLVRTGDQLRRATAELLRPHALSGTSYNILRILRGAGAAGLPCREVTARLVAHDPDVTRLADRLIAAGWVERDRAPGDRRVVILRLTAPGSTLLACLDQPMLDLHRRQFGNLDGASLAALIHLLERVRDPPPPSPETP